jgi:hypothetical protein
VRRLEVIDIVMRAHRTRAFDQLGEHLLHASARQVVEQLLDDDETVATVLRQALGIDVGHRSFLSLLPSAPSMVALTFMLVDAWITVKHG